MSSCPAMVWPTILFWTLNVIANILPFLMKTVEVIRVEVTPSSFLWKKCCAKRSCGKLIHDRANDLHYFLFNNMPDVTTISVEQRPEPMRMVLSEFFFLPSGEFSNYINSMWERRGWILTERGTEFHATFKIPFIVLLDLCSIYKCLKHFDFI